MNIFLCPNVYTQKQIDEAKECISVLEKLGHVCSMAAEDNKNIGKKELGFSAEECDLVVSLGGDGSVLRASQIAVRTGKPLFGINSGRLGYLCAMSFGDIERFDEIFAESVIEKRLLLDVSYAGEHYYALNDAVLMRDNFSQSLDLTIRLDNDEQLKIRGDGVIISTPTGSTAYNQSAGGPIVHSGAKVLAITPLYAKYGLTRTLIVDKNCKISIGERDNQAFLSVDGNKLGIASSSIEISVAECQLQLYNSTANKIFDNEII